MTVPAGYYFKVRGHLAPARPAPEEYWILKRRRVIRCALLHEPADTRCRSFLRVNSATKFAVGWLAEHPDMEWIEIHRYDHHGTGRLFRTYTQAAKPEAPAVPPSPAAPTPSTDTPAMLALALDTMSQKHASATIMGEISADRSLELLREGCRFVWDTTQGQTPSGVVQAALKQVSYEHARNGTLMEEIENLRRRIECATDEAIKNKDEIEELKASQFAPESIHDPGDVAFTVWERIGPIFDRSALATFIDELARLAAIEAAPLAVKQIHLSTIL